ncbi:hypothetical protein [Engelhardtia mirabilis]|uniref:Alpha/beta hydrolase family protein n=1 Tax=Engelhardtia mirabilis TaxID=2528011 RepID=A0A518BFR3_9BACT|nr:Alpha/beta hydrolase family protein [Planctomycetes bacterium Pla133]QDV00153.1 Alpha/beta hydrolase family protein [Planctomycetes bacterium Pla86]
MQLAPALAVAALAFSFVGLQDSEPPLDKDRVDALVDQYLELGPRAVGTQWARQREILVSLESLPVLDARAEKDWREDLLERWMEGPQLPSKKKSGQHYLWEEREGGERGKYIVGGKTKKPKGLVISMHGGGLGSGDAGAAASAFGSAVSDRKWLGIFPEVLEKTEHGWTTSGTEEFVLELVDRAVRTYELDRDHIYLCGHSMGGYGTWTLGARHADRWAGLAASAGAPTPLVDREGVFYGIDWGVIPNLRNTRLVVYQSGDDPQVPPDANRVANAEVGKAKAQWGGYEGFEYWEENGYGHDAPPGGFGDFLERIGDAERDACPNKLVWQPVLSWKRQFYWLFWESPVPGEIVVAELVPDENEVRLTAERLGSGFSILLNDGMLDLSKDVVVRLNDKVVFRGKAEPTLASLLLTGVTGDPERTYSARVHVTD